jgi:hypothetical protein
VRLLVAASVGLVALSLGEAVWAAPKVAVQPVAVQDPEGPSGASIRNQVSRIVRAKGFRVTTSVPQVSGTGQYLTFARDHALAAFVVTELETWGKGKYQKVTFLVWNGSDGSVVGRWSVAASARKMGKAIAKDFWKRLGPAIERAQAPPEAEELGPAPPMVIDASSPYDDPVVSDGGFRRRQ